MWLRDFLCKDLPHCRTMVYSYNLRLSSHSVSTIMDFSRELKDQLQEVRGTKDVSRGITYTEIMYIDIGLTGATH